jgi:uncharacterized protein YjdB
MECSVRYVALALAMAVMAWCPPASAGNKASVDRLERITLGPREARRTVGESQHFTATGHYTSGTTRNLTQKVEYVSSDPAVVRAPNAKGERSRVEALAAGKATITATDPKTGVSTHESGDDATMTVMGALQRLTLSPAGVNRWVGQSQRLTAIGHYAGGATRNLTQRVVYTSSDPAVVAAPNVEGDKSRVDALTIGSATISAVDPETGISSSTTGGDTRISVSAKGSAPMPIH